MNAKYRQERQFALVLAAILAVIGLWPLLDGRTPAWFWLGLAALLMGIAWLAAGVLTPVVRIWIRVGHVIGLFNTKLLLAIAFFVFITPLALAFRLFGRDPLGLRHRKQASYWHVHEKRWTPDSFKNQF